MYTPHTQSSESYAYVFLQPFRWTVPLFRDATRRDVRHASDAPPTHTLFWT